MPKDIQKKETDAAKAKARLNGLLGKRLELPAGGLLSRKVSLPAWVKRMGGYFAGSFAELRQVSWPNRRTSIGLTMAVILFAAFLAAFTLAVDSAFDQLFKGVIIK